MNVHLFRVLLYRYVNAVQGVPVASVCTYHERSLQLMIMASVCDVTCLMVLTDEASRPGNNISPQRCAHCQLRRNYFLSFSGCPFWRLSTDGMGKICAFVILWCFRNDSLTIDDA